MNYQTINMETIALGLTDIGMVRKNNQDSIYIDNNKLLYIVCDGMGGHAGGEIASQMVIDHFENLPRENFPRGAKDQDIQIFLEKNVNLASCEIFLRSMENQSYKDMGTTCSLVWLDGNKAHCAHAGDSRIYIQRSNFLYQVSEDHSLVAEQLKAGLITEKQAENHILKNVITRSVGHRKEEHVDTFSIVVKSGDRLLICSDGLHNKLTDHQIAQVLSSNEKQKEKILVDMANKKGGEDNISTIIINIM